MKKLSEGKIYIISAPGGTGKTTLVQKLLDEFSNVKRSITCTTRKPRKGEVQGEDYHFLNQTEFDAMVLDGDFLEYVSLYDCAYGTPKKWVLEQKAKGYHVVLVIDTQGALALKDKIEAILIFLSPPSIEELRKRLEGRKTENSKDVEKRISLAEHEIAQAKHYDYHITNDNLEDAYRVLRSIFIAEEYKVEKNYE